MKLNGIRYITLLYYKVIQNPIRIKDKPGCNLHQSFFRSRCYSKRKYRSFAFITHQP